MFGMGKHDADDDGIVEDYVTPENQKLKPGDEILPLVAKHIRSDGTMVPPKPKPENGKALQEVRVTEGGFTRADLVGKDESHANDTVEASILMSSERLVTLRGNASAVSMALATITSRPDGFVRLPASLMSFDKPLVINRAEIACIDIAD